MRVFFLIHQGVMVFGENGNSTGLWALVCTLSENIENLSMGCLDEGEIQNLSELF